MSLRTLNIVLVGMVVVFAVLALLIICIRIYSAIISKFSNKNTNSDRNNFRTNDVQRTEIAETIVVNNTSTVQNGLNPELIAVIASAIAAIMSGSGDGFRVKSIKRIGHTTPIWNVAGRNEYILTKL